MCLLYSSYEAWQEEHTCQPLSPPSSSSLLSANMLLLSTDPFLLKEGGKSWQSGKFGTGEGLDRPACVFVVSEIKYQTPRSGQISELEKRGASMASMGWHYRSVCMCVCECVSV